VKEGAPLLTGDQVGGEPGDRNGTEPRQVAVGDERRGQPLRLPQVACHTEEGGGAGESQPRAARGAAVTNTNDARR
jgi:hypothetical protein